MASSEKRTRRSSRKKLGRGLSALVETGTHEPARDPLAIDLHEAGSQGKSADRVHEIEIDAIQPNKNQPRAMFDEEGLESLAGSIRETGLMQPIVVRPAEFGGYEIIAGERRWRACKLAGLGVISAVVREVDDRHAAEWALIENIQREDLNPMEKAAGYRRLSEQFGLTQQQIAQRMGVGRASVANTIRLLDLDEGIRGMIEGGELSGGHGKALLQCKDPAQRARLAKKAVAEGWTVRALERAAGDQENAPPKNGGGEKAVVRSGRVGTVLADLEQQLTEYLGTRVVLRTNQAGTKGRVQIEFYDLDHFDGVMERMGFSPKES